MSVLPASARRFYTRNSKLLTFSHHTNLQNRTRLQGGYREGVNMQCVNVLEQVASCGSPLPDMCHHPRPRSRDWKRFCCVSDDSHHDHLQLVVWVPSNASYHGKTCKETRPSKYITWNATPSLRLEVRVVASAFIFDRYILI
jgi:hypothetical protein